MLEFILVPLAAVRDAARVTDGEKAAVGRVPNAAIQSVWPSEARSALEKKGLAMISRNALSTWVRSDTS